MSLAAIVKAMADSGCSGEQIAAAVAAHESGIEAKDAQRRATASARKKRWRDSKCPAMSTGHDGTERDDTGHHPPGSSPNDSITLTPSSSPPSSLRSVRDRARAAFSDFWSAYPRREGSNPKQPAEGKFIRLVEAGEDPAAIVEGAERYAASVVHAEPRFTAQAVTWLNQGRWRDDHRPPVPQARAGPGRTPQRGRTVAEMAAMILDDEPDFFHVQQPRTDPLDRTAEGSRDPHESRSGFAGRLSFEASAAARRSALVDH